MIGILNIRLSKFLRVKNLVNPAKIEVARNMIKRGRPLKEIVEDTGLSLEDVKGLNLTGADFGPRGR
jgi:hypothetical protein